MYVGMYACMFMYINLRVRECLYNYDFKYLVNRTIVLFIAFNSIENIKLFNVFFMICF